MQVKNIHECRLESSAPVVGALLDALGSDKDRLWPHDHWPTIYLDRPLAVGAVGGHGPISYTVEAYQPGRMVKFRFTGPPGFDGHHWFEAQPDGQRGTILRHTIRMKVTGWARLSWLLIIRPLHDALVEDALYLARRAVGMPSHQPRWSLWVRLLRRLRYRLPPS